MKELYEFRHFPSAHHSVAEADCDSDADVVHIVRRAFSFHPWVQGAQQVTGVIYILGGSGFGSVVVCCHDRRYPSGVLNQPSGCRGRLRIHLRSRMNVGELLRPVANQRWRRARQ